MKSLRTFQVVPASPERLIPLKEIAYNLWWAWNQDAIDLFSSLDRALWDETGYNPVMMLERVSQKRLEEVAQDDHFMEHLRRVQRALRDYMASRDTWFESVKARFAEGFNAAYFSMEYGINQCLRVYSGGLGILAGEHLKSASDLGMPLVGVGLMYREGRFHQRLSADGWQQEEGESIDVDDLPVQLVTGDDGQPLMVSVPMPGRDVHIQVWRVQVGRVPLYLLDTKVPQNSDFDQATTAELYGGDGDMRLRQEIVLGMGGIRALRALGLAPTVYHMNEGHAAFLTLERIRQARQELGLALDEAIELTSAGNIFTTHTPVPAGIDLFDAGHMQYYFADFCREQGLDWERFLQLGRPPQHQANEPVSMAVLALQLSALSNGVSERHGQVARSMWCNLWPSVPAEEVPITHVTNGVHPQTWLSRPLTEALERASGRRLSHDAAEPRFWQSIEKVSDEELWAAHEKRRHRLIEIVRQRVRAQLARYANGRDVDAEVDQLLDPNALTIGFARRFATYKRATLLFRDAERLARILNATDRPVQVIYAGKAHPNNNPGKELLRQLVHYTREDRFKNRVVFVEDYDMALARYLVQGVDVWLNTPLEGEEASGTSGMKVAMNGGLHLSTFDGWWCEGYSPEVGWRIGSGEILDQALSDEVGAESLYQLLEHEVVPLFYTRGHDGLPHGWISRQRHAISRLSPEFSTHRMVKDYATRMYLPVSRRAVALSADGAARARAYAEWLGRVRRHWSAVRFDTVQVNVGDEARVREAIRVEARVWLDGLDPDDLSVQVCYGNARPDGSLHDHQIVEAGQVVCEEGDFCRYAADIAYDETGLKGLAVRIVPRHADLPGCCPPGLMTWAG
ncbi:MAG: alpha-glucan family phosphorylase [Anaerolineae bacterium]|jgi:starch phosphorylase